MGKGSFPVNDKADQKQGPRVAAQRDATALKFRET